MNEFIDAVGYNNFIILLSIVGVIILLLIVLFIIDKVNLSRQNKLTLKKSDLDSKDFIHVETKKEVKKQKESNEIKTHSNEHEVVYVEKQDEKELARKTLEDTATKLQQKAIEMKREKEEVKVDEIAPHTDFEKTQELNSIISYEELKKASKNIDHKNDVLLADEGNEPITIEELYKKHQEKQFGEPEDLENPVFAETRAQVSKFKKSEVISPVFGVYNKNYTNYSVDKFYNTMDLKDIENEIRKTEEFLNQLKEIRSKLN